MRHFLTENYVHALEKLSAWDDIASTIDPKVDFDSEWRIAKYICAATHLQIEKPECSDILQEALECLKKRGKSYLKDEYPLEMASIFLKKGKDCSRWTEIALKKCLKDWTGKNPYHVDSHQTIIYFMQQCSNFVKGPIGDLSSTTVKRQLSNDLQVNDHLMNQWKIISGGKLSNQDLQEVTYHGLDICNQQGQIKVAKKLLKSLTIANGDETGVRATPKFYQHETRTVLGVCLNPSRGDPDLRFNNLYRTYMKFDGPTFSKLPLVDKSSLKGSVLNGLAEIMSDLTNVTSLRQLLSSYWLSEEKKQHLKSHFLKSEGSYSSENDCSKWIFKTRAVMEMKQANNPFELAKYCYSLTQDFPPNMLTEDIITCLLEAHITSIKQGSKMARKLFPKLLILAENIVLKYFKVPCFLPSVYLFDNFLV